MTVRSARFRRNLFEIENARNLTVDEVVRTFVPPQSFWRLLSPKNHILLGSRGSGKTAIARMLSHDHLARLEDQRAKTAIDARAFIGIYVPTRLEWVGSMRNKVWQTDEQREQAFCWRLNVATCLAYLRSIRSCLDIYVSDRGDRIRNERSLATDLSRAWAGHRKHTTLIALHEYLEELEYARQLWEAELHVLGQKAKRAKPIGPVFSMELFAPLRRALSIASNSLHFPEDTAWLLCLDEAEFLDREQQVILNSHMRAYSGNLFFKIATMPYFHYTTETNTSVSLEPGHDFDYVYLDRDPVFVSSLGTKDGVDGSDFAQLLFKRRATISGPKYSSTSLAKLLGRSELLDPKPDAWNNNSEAMVLMQRYASKDTIARAQQLGFGDRFSSEIGRKIHGALLLRDRVASSVGHKKLNVYSGATMVVRCGDANPRRLIRIFNAMLLAARWRDVRGYKRAATISPTKQTEILLTFSDQTLGAVQSEPQYGPSLFRFLEMIGQYMRFSLYEQPLRTDQVSSFSIDANVADADWTLIQRAVAVGLLYPNVNHNNPDELPMRKGVFHLAYALAPHFRLLPRRGKARHLKTIREFWAGPHDMGTKDDVGQLWLFGKE